MGEVGVPPVEGSTVFALGDLGLAEDFEGAEGSGIATFDTEFLEDAAEVLFHGLVAHAEDGGDIEVALALGDPEEDFGFARGEGEFALEGCGGAEVGIESLASLAQGFGESFLDGFSPGETGLDGGQQVFADDGLGQVIVRPEVHADADVGFVAAGGEEDEGGGGELTVGTKALHDAVAIHLGHHDVAKDQVRQFASGGLDAGDAVGGGDDIESFHFEEQGEIPAHGSLVFDDEDLFRAHGCGRRLIRTDRGSHPPLV